MEVDDIFCEPSIAADAEAEVVLAAAAVVVVVGKRKLAVPADVVFVVAALNMKPVVSGFAVVVVVVPVADVVFVLEVDVRNVKPVPVVVTSGFVECLNSFISSVYRRPSIVKLDVPALFVGRIRSQIDFQIPFVMNSMSNTSMNFWRLSSETYSKSGPYVTSFS